MTTPPTHGDELADPGSITTTEADAPAVLMRNVTKRYGTKVALDDVSLVVDQGSICGLIGPNGAGKSTLMSIVATLITASTGQVEVFGRSIDRPSDIRKLIGYVPDVLCTYSGLTVEEYLLFFADAYHVSRENRDALVDGLLELVDLTGKKDADINTLSRGMKQRIGLARGLVHEPRLLILDEPASGLDPRARIELRDILLHLNSMGVTVLISSHILSELEELCSDVIVLEQGRLVGMEGLDDQSVRVVTVSFLGGEVESFELDGDEAQVELVRTLVTQGRQVLSVEIVSTGLEERFMRMTEGRTN